MYVLICYEEGKNRTMSPYRGVLDLCGISGGRQQEKQYMILLHLYKKYSFDISLTNIIKGLQNAEL